MAWERRARGGLYYTRSRKMNGRVVREYIGAGETAALIAQLDALERQSKEQERAAEREELARLAALESLVRPICDEVDRAYRETLSTAGYHQHKRGEWRKKRARSPET